MVRAWISSKNTATRSRQRTSSTASVTPPISASCTVSAGVMARMLPITMVWIDTAIGCTEMMNSPRPKNAVKISPITTSDFSPERSCSASIEAAASPPATKAPSAKGRPSRPATATPGTTEWLSASPMSDQPFSIR